MTLSILAKTHVLQCAKSGPLEIVPIDQKQFFIFFRFIDFEGHVRNHIMPAFQVIKTFFQDIFIKVYAQPRGEFTC